MLSRLLNIFGGGASEEQTNSAEALIEEPEVDGFEVVNTEDVDALEESASEQNPESVAISYFVRPLLYTAKYGAEALYATALVMGYTLEGISYCIAGTSHIPHEISKLLEKHKEQNKDTAEHKVIVCTTKFLDCTSSAMYGLSYIPYCTGEVLLQVAYASDSASKYLSSEKREKICDHANSFLQGKPGNLEEINVNSAAQAAARGA